MMDRASYVALVAAGREIRAAVRTLQPVVTGEDAEAALAELTAIAHRIEMLPGPDVAAPTRAAPVWSAADG